MCDETAEHIYVSVPGAEIDSLPRTFAVIGIGTVI